jgi:hypothetical protein
MPHLIPSFYLRWYEETTDQSFGESTWNDIVANNKRELGYLWNRTKHTARWTVLNGSVNTVRDTYLNGLKKTGVNRDAIIDYELRGKNKLVDRYEGLEVIYQPSELTFRGKKGISIRTPGYGSISEYPLYCELQELDESNPVHQAAERRTGTIRHNSHVFVVIMYQPDTEGNYDFDNTTDAVIIDHLAWWYEDFFGYREPTGIDAEMLDVLKSQDDLAGFIIPQYGFEPGGIIFDLPVDGEVIPLQILTKETTRLYLDGLMKTNRNLSILPELYERVTGIEAHQFKKIIDHPNNGSAARIVKLINRSVGIDALVDTLLTEDPDFFATIMGPTAYDRDVIAADGTTFCIRGRH